MSWKKIKIKKSCGEWVEAQAPVIISASRSTDIPAFYSDWFINRLKEGYVKWKNTFNGVYSYVSFAETRLIVFWTKNAEPIIDNLNYLDDKHLNYYFQFTLNDYDAEKLEPRVPCVKKRIETFQNLSERIGKKKVIWRFYPLILTDKIGVDELLRKVENTGNQLQGYTEKLVFSFADIKIYRKVQHNLRSNCIAYQEFNERTMNEFSAGLQKLNENWRFELATCAEQIPLERFDIKHNKCVDEDLIIDLFHDDKCLMDFLGVKVSPTNIFTSNLTFAKTKDNKDKGQRELCGCIVSKNIGDYDTCPHLCEYCYANTNKNVVLTNWNLHKENPNNETIK